MDEAPPPTENDVLLSRFVESYSSAQERGARYWKQWMRMLGELPRQVIEGMAQDLATSEGISLAQAQSRLAAEKIANDMGEAWVRDWLSDYEAKSKERERLAQKPLQPLTLKSKKK
ncbi:MAG: hypothetical protein QM758_22130 [Armatimonas sp.]